MKISYSGEPDKCPRCGSTNLDSYLSGGLNPGAQTYICGSCGYSVKGRDKIGEAVTAAERAVIKKGWEWQFRWSKFLFRSPDLVLVILSWWFSLIFLISAGRNASFISNVMEWIVGSIFVAIAPVLTLMFVRKKKSGLGMVAGWMSAWRGDLRPVMVIVGISSVLFLIHLMMEAKPISRL